MEINVLEETKKRILVEVKGENSAFCNAIKRELTNDSHVKIASFKVEHPLVSSPKIIVETDGNEAPRKALEKAVEKLQKQAKDMRASFVKEVR